MTRYLRLIHGSLFDTTAGGLAHGVNTHGVMGKGIAADFRARFPGMYDDYRAQCRNGQLTPGGLLPWKTTDGRWVYNLATQDRPGRFARLEWIEKATRAALTHADAHQLDVVAFPQIGCGIGGLEWHAVEEVLTAVQQAHWVTIEIRVPSPTPFPPT